MTEKMIKEILGIEDWAEITTAEQFSVLLANFHLLGPRIRKKVISRISNLRDLTGMFYDNVAATFITYEPTVIMIFDPLIRLLDLIHEESGGVLSKQDMEFVSEVYRSFSEWYATEEGILLQTDQFEEMCTANEAYNMVQCVDSGLLNFGNMSMMLLTGERNEFLKQIEQEAEKQYSIDVDFLRQLLGREPDKNILDKSFRKYIN